MERNNILELQVELHRRQEIMEWVAHMLKRWRPQLVNKHDRATVSNLYHALMDSPKLTKKGK